MNANERELILKEEVFAIVEAAMEVSNERCVCFPDSDIGVHSRSFAVEEKGNRQ